MRRPNISIRPATSSSSRDQFSVENEYTVSSLMPSSTASRRRALTMSAPASCPAMTGRPRRCAQRPLPSVMMATYRACPPGPPDCEGSADSSCPALTGDPRTLDLEDVLFLVLEQLVQLPDARVGDLLELDLGAVLIVRTGLSGLLELAQVVHDVAADVADRHPPLLGDVAHHLDQLLAPLLRELGDRKADEVAVVAGGQAHIGFEYRPLDRLDRALVVGLDGEKPRLGRGHRGQLLERSRGSVIVHADPVKEYGAGPPGPHRSKLVAHRLDRLRHSLAGIRQQLVDHL